MDAETLVLALAQLRERYPDDAEYEAAAERLAALIDEDGEEPADA